MRKFLNSCKGVSYRKPNRLTWYRTQKTAKMLRCVTTGMILGFCIYGCVSPGAPAPEKSLLSDLRGGTIAVMPFLKGGFPVVPNQTTSRPLDCKLAQLCYEAQSLEPQADEHLTLFTHKALEDLFGQRVAPLQTSLEAYDKVAKDKSNDTPRTHAKKMGAALPVDCVIVGTVWRYVDRAGEISGSGSPASVAFTLYMVNVVSGETCWRATYDKTQQSLAENILDAPDFFRQGARWLTVDELARFGVNKVLKKLEKDWNRH